MKLYEINEAIESCIDTESGEVLDIEKLNELSLERDIKIENIACWIKNLESDSREIEEEMKNLRERKSAKDRKAESLKRYLQANLDGETFESARVRVGWRASERVQFENENEFLKNAPQDLIKTTIEINRSAVKEMLKDGLTVEGAYIERIKNLQIK